MEFYIKLLSKLGFLESIYYIGSGEVLPPPFKTRRGKLFS